MSATKYMMLAVLLISLAVGLSGRRNGLSGAPLAMFELVYKTAVCVEDRMVYRKVELKCSSSVTFSDFRKLDMRSDNLERSQTAGVKKVSP